MKPCAFRNIGEMNCNTCRPVSLFRYIYLCFSFVGWIILIINFIPVEKKYNIGILLNSAGFSEISQYRFWRPALFNTSIELAEGYNRNMQLLCQCFK